MMETTGNNSGPRNDLIFEENATALPNVTGSTQPVNDRSFASPFDDPLTRALFVVCYVTVFTLCVLGNVVVLAVILRTARMRTRTNFFLANLAVADLSVGVFCVLPTLSKFISQTWILGRVMCKLYYYVNNMSYTTSIILLTVIAVERYIAILFPLKAQQWITVRRLKISLVAIWLVSGSYNVPILFIFDAQTYGNNITYCYFTSSLIVNLYALHISNMVMWYVIPLALMSFMYGRISVVLWTSGNNVRLNPTSSWHPRENSGTSIRVLHKTRNIEPRHTGRFCTRDKYVRKAKFAMRPSPSVLTTESQISLPCDDNHRADAASQRLNKDLQNEITDNNETMIADSLEVDDRKKVVRGNLFSSLKVAFMRRQNKGFMTPDDVTFDDSSSPEWSRKDSTPYNNASAKNPQNTTLIARKKVIRLLLSVVICFSICVLPYHVNIILVKYGIVMSKFDTPIAYLILYLNSGLNPILYALLSENFRKSLREMLCRRCF